jgi:hypothetical protein
MLNIIIQIILSIFLISIMAFIGYSVYNREFINSIAISNTNKKITKIFTGILDYATDSDIDIETYDKDDFTYLDINPSINQNGGAEYSYNFWLFFSLNKINNTIIVKDDLYNNLSTTYNSTYNYNATDDTNKLKYIILFYKGEKQSLIINNTTGIDCNTKDKIYDPPILVKNPLIKIRNDGKEIVVEYNNINYPETYNSIGTTPINCDALSLDTEGSIKDRSINKFGIKDIDIKNYSEKFNMVTVVFQEQSKNENVFNKNKLNCRVYFNGELKADKLSNTNSVEDDSINNFKSRVMRSNLSKLHINPSKNQKVKPVKLSDDITEVSPLQMADLSYYNYALTNTEIKRLYNNGFNKYGASFKKLISKNYTKGFNNESYDLKPI